MEALAALLSEKESEGGFAATGRSLRKLNKQQQRTLEQPGAVVREYLTETMERMGVEQGDIWRVYHYSSKVPWGRFRGLYRMHYHTSHILDLLLHDKPDQAAGYASQLCRALHQVSLDQGQWDAAALLLPRPDPLQRVVFGGSPAEMEVVAGYRDTIRKLGRSHADAG